MYTRDSDGAVVASDNVGQSVDGQVVADADIAGRSRSRASTYDAAGRLTRADDTDPDGACARRDSLGRGQQGVASAMNDTTREVGSAVGIALRGSIYGSHYRSSLPDSVAQLPADAAESVRRSAAAGLHVADRLGTRGHGSRRRRQVRVHGRLVGFPDRGERCRARRCGQRPAASTQDTANGRLTLDLRVLGRGGSRAGRSAGLESGNPGGITGRRRQGRRCLQGAGMALLATTGANSRATPPPLP